ncbi:MAG: S8 family serine peptidase [Solirubrobacterales bacterium]
MRRTPPILAALALLAAVVCATPARAATGIAAAHGFVPGHVVVKLEGERRGRTLSLPAGTGVRETAATLRANPSVAYAVPDYVATASADTFVPPDDSGTLAHGAEAASAAGDWVFKQWNFLSPEFEAGLRMPTSVGGIDAVGAWQNLAEAGRPGGLGVTVAVLDTGVAYRDDGSQFLRSPDFAASQFARGFDFVDRDRLPLDENGHGTHVAATIGEETGNGIGLTGIAYNAKLMPVRVLDAHGRGRASDIAKGIRFAVRHGAQVINMSFNFGCGKQVPEVDEALREAYEQGVVAVASAGNLGSETCVSEPATGPRVIAVGGSTEGGCLGSYSLSGPEIDVLAPGGGRPSSDCASISSRPIYQVTLRRGSTDDFAIPGDYVGTSMAAAHVSGVAALVLAADTYGGPRLYPSGEQTPKNRVVAVTHWLRHTARDLGLSRVEQGAGLIDAAAATAPRRPSGIS